MHLMKLVQSLRLVTPPTVEPITLMEAREQLRLIASGSPPSHPDDNLVESLITVARQHLDGKDGILDRALITQEWELILDRFPVNEIRLPLSPLQSVESVVYDDLNGAEQTVSAGDYIVDKTSEPGWIVPVSGVSWPATIEGINAVRVAFTAGYGDAASDVPSPIIQAMKLLIAHWYANREPVVVGTQVMTIPLSVESLIATYRPGSFF